MVTALSHVLFVNKNKASYNFAKIILLKRDFQWHSTGARLSYAVIYSARKVRTPSPLHIITQGLYTPEFNFNSL